MNTTDTIAAPASGTGGAITVIRVSGSQALEIADRVWKGRKPLARSEVRKMYLGKIGSDDALAVYMKKPASYTGEDVVEIQCHGGAAAADNALKLLLDAGCRMAEPGEYTFRAFINGKMDLAQAEAVQDIISSGSTAAFDLAQKQLSGLLSEKLNALYDRISFLRSECEARLDFPDEDLDFQSDDVLADSCGEIRQEIDLLLSTRQGGSLLRDGVELVIAGRPNAGKSSLMNMLLGYDRAIVSSVPGTTRDTVESRTVLRDIPVCLTDTAGLRESSDPIETLGVERSRRSIAAARQVFWVLDSSLADPAEEIEELRASAPRNAIAVWNKLDLAPGFVPPETGFSTVAVSAATGAGKEELLDLFQQKLLAETGSGALPEVAVNARISDHLEKAAEGLTLAAEKFQLSMYELAASDLAFSMEALGKAVGKTVSPDVLDAVFHNFCIGK